VVKEAVHDHGGTGMKEHIFFGTTLVIIILIFRYIIIPQVSESITIGDKGFDLMGALIPITVITAISLVIALLPRSSKAVQEP
jgi:hypothetical protein